MADAQPQNYDNHTKFVPLFHYVATPMLLLNLLWTLYRAATDFSIDALFAVVVAIGLILVGLFSRIFALGAQDRVIRLEERLRMHGLLPDDLKPRIEEFSTDQLVALRFASDDELPELARKILDESIADRTTIKKMIVSWRADYQRL